MNGGRIIPAGGLFVCYCCSGVAVAAAEEAAAAAKVRQPSIRAARGSGNTRFNDNPAEFSLQAELGRQATHRQIHRLRSTRPTSKKRSSKTTSSRSSRSANFNGNKFTVHFDGKAEANDIVGTVGVDFGEGPREFDWHAKRFVDVGRRAGHLETTTRNAARRDRTAAHDHQEWRRTCTATMSARSASGKRRNSRSRTANSPGESNPTKMMISISRSPIAANRAATRSPATTNSTSAATPARWSSPANGRRPRIAGQGGDARSRGQASR